MPSIGSLGFAGLRGVGMEAQGTIPHLLFMAFQGTFAIITPALISGAVVERMRFNAYLAFIVLWVLAVYAPVAHWVWGGGFLATMGALDFAGGAVVHVNAASAALVAALVVGPRKDYGRHAILPHNVPFTLLGAGLLWFGWFGFNAGSALSAGTDRGPGVHEHAAGAGGDAGGLDADRPAARRHASPPSAPPPRSSSAWWSSRRRPVTSARSSAIAMGAIGAMPSYFALIYRAKTKLDDSLDVVAAHGLGGATGAILTGVFADAAWSGGAERTARRQSGAGADAGRQRADRAGLQRRARPSCILKLLGAGDAAADRPAATKGSGLDVSDHGEEAYTARRRRHPGEAEGIADGARSAADVDRACRAEAGL